MLRITGLFLLAAAAAFGQTFEVATIKAVEPISPLSGRVMIRMGASGGPGTPDPTLYKCAGCPVAMLVMHAYDVKRFQVVGAATFEGERYDVTAKVPEGATKEQFRVMLQNLLKDRFKVALHHESKDMPKFDLVVAKGGPKLKPSAPAEAGAPPSYTDKIVPDRDGNPVLPKGANATMMMPGGRARSQMSGATMEQLAAFLSNQVGKPVTDATGIQGKYDVVLSFAIDMSSLRMVPGMQPPPAAEGADADAGPTIFTAIQEQLGLRLEAKKGPVDMVVVDHVEKNPTEN